MANIAAYAAGLKELILWTVLTKHWFLVSECLPAMTSILNIYPAQSYMYNTQKKYSLYLDISFSNRSGALGSFHVWGEYQV